jgi:hypothetical protein
VHLCPFHNCLFSGSSPNRFSVGGGFIYLLIVYLDFPYLFYGRKCFNANGFGHFFFTPVTGVWYPQLRRLFYLVFGFIMLANLSSIFLTLMWIALGILLLSPHLVFDLTSAPAGVVVNPSLAIPYATGIVVFFTNLGNVKNSLMNWQQLVVDEVLERLVPFLKTLIGSQEFVTNSIQPVVETVLNSLQNSSEKTTASDMKQLVDILVALKKQLSTNPSDLTFRKLKESEITELLRSLWLSIREELGLSTRNVFIAVISSSLILGMLLMFIFIGIATQQIHITRNHIRVVFCSKSNLHQTVTFISGVSVFAPTDNPFASVVNSLLTVGAGLGLFRNQAVASCITRVDTVQE